MALPNNLVLVRHGESEANYAQKLERNGLTHQIPSEFWNRHDWEHRLTQAGVDQAIRAGKWITAHIGDCTTVFDRRYVSPFIRTRETALHLGGVACADWLKDDRLVERNWGTYGATPLEERAALYAHTEKVRQQSSLYAQLDNGESIGYGTIFRFRNWLDTLHRDMDGKTVLAVTHGEFMWAARYVLENMLPEEWDQYDADKTQKLRNCSIVQYTRVHPETGLQMLSFGWRRIIYPDTLEESPDNGEWRPLPGKRYLTPDQLEQGINQVDKIFND